MYDWHWHYNPARYCRCRVSKNRWFWAVFDSLEDVLWGSGSAYGYEPTAAAAEARARQVAGPGARKTFAYDAVEFRKSLRAGAGDRRRTLLVPRWSVVLGLTLPCRLDDVKTAYRRLAKTAHPDAGGNAKDFIAIEGAYREGLTYCQRNGSAG
jgi:hypothetical protein